MPNAKELENDEKEPEPVSFEDSGISWIYTPGSGVIEPPVEARGQELPFEKLDWRDFERLCLRLARMEADLERCRLYGVQGDDQQGIDIYARKAGSEKYTVYQCKNEQEFGPSKIESAVTKFSGHSWASKSEAFVLCTRESLKSTQRTNEIEKQTNNLRKKGIALIVWDKDELSNRLKLNPEVIDDFFGRAWVKFFCGADAAAKFNTRLDIQRLQELRSQLLPLYQSTFNTHDRGIPVPNALPLLKRFVIPDIENLQMLSAPKQGNIVNLEIQSSKESAKSSEDGSDSTFPIGTARRSPQEYISRIPLQNWLIRGTGKRNLIIGEPGSGKSSLLRYIATDLLSENPSLNILAEQWGNFLPVFIPFAAWTKMIDASGVAAQSIKGMAIDWLKSIDANKQIPLIEEALEDKRLLLLIDGLDEYSNEGSATMALNRMEAFIASHDVTIVATSRPHSLERLTMSTEDWQCGSISNLSKKQQESLATLWFHVHSANENPAKDLATIKIEIPKKVEAFFVEIKKSPQLYGLVKNPMQLSLLILFKIQNIRLPGGRFEAYKTLTEYLVSKRPLFRDAASGVASNQYPKIEDILNALAQLAYCMHVNCPEGILNKVTCLKTLIEYFEDPVAGMGLDRSNASINAQHILDLATDNYGVLIYRTNDDLGFFHRSIEEYLVSRSLIRQPLETQVEIVGSHCSDPLWREPILGLLQLSTRPGDSKALIEAIDDKIVEKYERKIIDLLLAEIAFGDFKCPPDVAKNIARKVFDEIENGTWLVHREKLLQRVLEGLRSPIIQEMVKEKIRIWFPNKLGYSHSRVVDAMGDWSSNSVLIDTLFRVLNAEDFETKKAAAVSLAKLARGDDAIFQRLLEILSHTEDYFTVAVVTDAVIVGWPKFQKLPEILERLTDSRVPILSFTGIKGKIALGIQSDSDLKKLIRLGNWESGIYPKTGVARALIGGWPRSDKVKKLCLDAVVRRPTHTDFGLDSEVALEVLLEGYPMDEAVVDYCIQEIKKQEHSFLIRDMEAFYALSRNFRGHPALILALDEWSKGAKHQNSEAARAALVGRTGAFKKRLLEDLGDSFPQWAAKSLLEGWGMQDVDVAVALTKMLSGPAKNASQISHLAPQIITDPQKCRNRLLEILGDSECYRFDFVMDGLLKLDTSGDDPEIVDAAIKVLEEKTDRYREGLKEGLIEAYKKNSKVRKLALETLDDRGGAYKSVASCYGDDLEIRNKILSIVTPLPVSLRRIIVKHLCEIDFDQDFSLSMLSLFDQDVDKQVKVQASIGYHALLKERGLVTEQTLKSLSEMIVCGGPDHDERRQAAFCGLAIVERLDIMIGMKDKFGERLVSINSIDTLHPNEPHIIFILKNWARLKEQFADEFWNRLFRFHSSPSFVYGGIAPFVDEYDMPKKEIMEYLEQRNPLAASDELLRFLARNKPSSKLLLEYCFNILDLNDTRAMRDNTALYLSHYDEMAAIELLGDHFFDDESVLKRLYTERNRHELSELLLILSRGWPKSNELKETVSEMARIRVPCSDLVGITWSCYGSSPVSMYRKMSRLFRICSSLPKTIRSESMIKPITKRLQRDVELRVLFHRRLASRPSPSEKINIAKLLYRAEGLTPDLNKWIHDEVQVQTNLIEAGVDITQGSFKSILQALYEILSHES